ncbi:AAA family ATPase [Pseudodonghicola sp.]|uniref:AAA family ATPase n=1 Tax=Pseudodonghicola sp. TaxID=1969463 RepID=UPI003A988164
MPRIPFIHARFPDPKDTERALVERLQDHLRGLRSQRRRRPEDGADAEPTDAPAGDAYKLDLDRDIWGELTASDRARIDRRAACLHKARMAATGLAHLKKEDRERLAVLKDGVRLAEIETEHRADELAAALHAEFPWFSAATERVWHAMRRSVREGWPGLRLPPLLLDGAPGIGKSAWARELGTLIGAPSMVVEATNEGASFGIIGSQRGWSNAAPGRVLQTILQSRVGNPLVIIDEVEKAGSVHSSNGRSFDLTTSLLPLLEPATARDWSCPFFEVRFDMGWIGWVMTTNDARLLPEPLLSRCPPLRLRDPSLEELIGFAQRQGSKRGLSEASIEAVVEALRRASCHARRLSLRTVIRMLDLAERLEAGPVKQ